MKKYFLRTVFFYSILFLVSCANQSVIVFVPVPDSNFFVPVKDNEIGRILQTRDGDEEIVLPDWLFAFLNGGIEEVEQIDLYTDKYVFIARSEGVYFTAMEKWAENFLALHDLAIMAAARIEKRLISAASLYPDNEYGQFFEVFVKNAYSAGYPGAVKEDTYWVKVSNNVNSNVVYDADLDIYNFFILISIDKLKMQAIIESMITQTIAVVSPTEAQSTAINRLQQTFFEEF